MAYVVFSTNYITFKNAENNNNNFYYIYIAKENEKYLRNNILHKERNFTRNKRRKKKKKTRDLIDPMIIKNHLQLKSVESGHFELVCSVTSLLSFPFDRVT